MSVLFFDAYRLLSLPPSKWRARPVCLPAADKGPDLPAG